MATTPKETQAHEVDAYEHEEKRLNTIAVGASAYYAQEKPETVHYDASKTDPNIDPNVDPNTDPRLEWAKKTQSFDAPIVGIHTHERMTSERVVRALLADWVNVQQGQGFLFESDVLRRKRQADSLEAYKHSEAWTNRLIAGDSLLVMTSLLRKEAMAGKVQCVYMDPPYGISYGSNFQAFANKRDVKDKKDEDIPAQPEMVKAFRDTWELGIHSYLTYIRERLLVARELLADSGSCFVQIGDENVHLVRCVMDEVFGRGNFVSQITVKKTGGFASSAIDNVSDYIVWYAKDKEQMKYRQLYNEKASEDGYEAYNKVELKDGTVRALTKEEQDNWALITDGRIFRVQTLQSEGASNNEQAFSYNGKTYKPSKNAHWKTSIEGLDKLAEQGRIVETGTTLGYKRYIDDFNVTPIINVWTDVASGSGMNKIYVVQTNTKVIQRCLLMTTDPGDLVLDPTCGSGTTAFVAEQWGRRWITCDTSRVALTLAEKRLATATFDWYVLNKEGVVSSGFKYKTVPHVTLKSIANGEEAASEVLYDKPLVDKTRVRVAGPFTVEALPAPMGAQAEVAPPTMPGESNPAPLDTQRGAEQSEVEEWCRELRQSGVLSKGGERLMFNRVALSDEYKDFQAEAETKDGRAAAVMFSGARYTLDTARVASALFAAQNFSPMPKLLIFAAFEFSAEAQRYIADAAPHWAERGVTVLHTLMNNDLLTRDLRKGADSSMSFFMVGQPDVVLRKVDEGNEAGKYQVEVRGFDYYSVAKGIVVPGGVNDIAMWMLDTDYDGLVIHPAQVFFPNDGDGAWRAVARSLRAEVDTERMEAFKGCVSLPFKMRDSHDARVAVKIVDNRGIESMRVLGRENR